MEDSPLVKQIDNTSHLSNGPANTIQLMVNPNTEAPAGALSSSSSISTTSSSSCNSCCAPGYLPKSSSNPMLLSLATSSSSIASVATVSPTSANPGEASTGNINHQFQQNSVIDMFINKKSVDTDANQTYEYASSNTSLVTVSSNSNSSNNLLTSMNQQTGGINSAVETAAKKYRCAAQISEATCCWKGNKFEMI